MKARWITISAIAVALAVLNPLAAQAAGPVQDPDDVGPLMSIDIKSARVEIARIPGEGMYAFNVESYEPFGPEALQWSGGARQSLAFVIDYPSTPNTPKGDLRIRVRYNDTYGYYEWSARDVLTKQVVIGTNGEGAFRPSDTVLTVLLKGEVYSDIQGEDPFRWKAVYSRKVGPGQVEVDSAPNQGWAEFPGSA
jgi:hypothetical protein